MVNTSERTKGVIALVIVALVYASVGIPIRVLESHVTLLQQLYLWLSAATIISILLFRRSIRSNALLRMRRRDATLIVYRAVSFYVLGYLLFSYGITHAPYGNVAMIYAFPMTPILGILLLHEKLTSVKTLAVLGGFSGALLVSVKNISGVASVGVGELASLLSLILFASAIIARKWHTEKLNNYELTTAMFFIATFTTFTLSVMRGEPLPFATLQPVAILAVIIIGILNTVGLLFTNYGYERVEAIVGGIITNLETVFAIGIAILLYREIPSIVEAAGGILIVTSAMLVNRDIKLTQTK